MYHLNILNDTNNVILNTKLQIHDEERRSVGVTPEKYSRQLSSLFENKFDLKRGSLPLVFIDTHYNRWLWNTIVSIRLNQYINSEYEIHDCLLVYLKHPLHPI